MANNRPRLVRLLQAGVSGSKTITSNGSHDVRDVATAIVNVPAGGSGITPSGSLQISENGSYDVTLYAGVVVDVPQGGSQADDDAYSGGPVFDIENDVVRAYTHDPSKVYTQAYATDTSTEQVTISGTKYTVYSSPLYINGQYSAAQGILYKSYRYSATDATQLSDRFAPDMAIGFECWTEWPRPVTLSAYGATRCIVTDSADPSWTLEMDTTGIATADSKWFLAYNLVPGRIYNWRALDASGYERNAGQFKAAGTVRMIKIGIPNFRDLGGYACDGGKVAYGRLFRGCGYTSVGGSSVCLSASRDTAICDTLQWLGVTKDLDLRVTTDSGIQKATDPGYSAAGYSSISYVCVSTSAYDTDASNSRTKAIKTALENIASTLSAGGAVWFHCATGADRTGTLAAIILALLGCSVDVIMKDWEFTALSGQCYFNPFTYSSSRTDMRTFLKAICALSGANLKAKMEGWLTSSLGVSAATISTIRSQMVTTS